MLSLSIIGALLEQELWVQLLMLNFANGFKHTQLSNSYTLILKSNWYFLTLKCLWQQFIEIHPSTEIYYKVPEKYTVHNNKILWNLNETHKVRFNLREETEYILFCHSPYGVTYYCLKFTLSKFLLLLL